VNKIFRADAKFELKNLPYFQLQESNLMKYFVYQYLRIMTWLCLIRNKLIFHLPRSLLFHSEMNRYIYLSILSVFHLLSRTISPIFILQFSLNKPSYASKGDRRTIEEVSDKDRRRVRITRELPGGYKGVTGELLSYSRSVPALLKQFHNNYL
jgi:hypothetical protein